MRLIDANHLKKWILARALDAEKKATKPLDVVEILDQIDRELTIEPELYGYKIEHLALIARVMQKEGVTPEKAVQTFVDMKRIVEMLIEETQKNVERAVMEAEHERI